MMRRFVVLIAIVSALALLSMVMAGLVSARGQAPRYADAPEALVTLPKPAATPHDVVAMKRTGGSIVQKQANQPEGASLTITPGGDLLPNQTVTLAGRGFSTEGSLINGRKTVDGIPFESIVSISGDTTDLHVGTYKLNEGDPISVNNDGNWSAPFIIPISETTLTAATHELMITDNHGQSGSASFTIPERTLTLSPSESVRGSRVEITGTGFPADNANVGGEPTVIVEISYVSTRESALRTVARLIPDGSGHIQGSFTVPLDAVAPSSNGVTASFHVGDLSIFINTVHTIPRPSITLDPPEGPSGATVSISGEGFGAFTSVEVINFGTLDVRPAGGVATDAEGSFSTSFLVPNSNSGSQPVTVRVGGTTATATFTVTAAQTTSPDRAELVAFYNATDGPNWLNNTNWLSEGPIGEWYGVSTNDSGRVVDLFLVENQLSGTIPPELAHLAELEHLYLSINQLRGEIPEVLGSLANLLSLELGGNQLSGEMPAWLGSLANLQGLYLWGNQLSGEIPEALGSLANLTQMHLEENQLSGEMPEALGNLANLEYLRLDENRLSGEIPEALGNLANLEYLRLDENQLSGEIPEALGNLANLTELDLSRNQLSGQIPPELGSLNNLKSLWLSGNRLEGCTPQGLEGVRSHDLSALRLPVCGALDVPVIAIPVIPGANSLTISWLAASSSGSAITAYDLRYIRSDADEKTVDANWTVVEDVWTGPGPLQYVLTGLTSVTQYDIQTRAVRAAGEGPWSAAALGTAATWGATRSFSSAYVAPGSLVVVTIATTGYGASGKIEESLPPGFRYVSSSLPEGPVRPDYSNVTFTLSGMETFTYTVAVTASREGSYSFSGSLINADGLIQQVGGISRITVQGLPSVHAARNTETPVRLNSPIPVTVTFSEPVSGFTADDIVVENGAVGNFTGSGVAAVYIFDITPNAVGAVTMNIAADVAEDADGNGNTSAPQLSLGVPYDDDGVAGISRDEAIAAIIDYFADRITKEHAIEVIILYFASR